MIKDTKKKKRNSEEDENLVEGLATAINAGYLTKTKPKFTKKNNFSASNLPYGSGECPRYWYLAFDGQIFYRVKAYLHRSCRIKINLNY